MPEFAFTVTVTAETDDEANQVMSERINVEEDYGFEYSIDWTDGHESTEWGIMRTADGVILSQPSREAAEQTIAYEASHPHGVPAKLIRRTAVHTNWRIH